MRGSVRTALTLFGVLAANAAVRRAQSMEHQKCRVGTREQHCCETLCADALSAGMARAGRAGSPGGPGAYRASALPYDRPCWSRRQRVGRRGGAAAPHGG